MPVFTYTAHRSDGKQVVGSTTADTASTARRQLREQGLQLLGFQPAQFKTQHQARASVFGRRRRQEQVVDFARQFSLLLRTGIPMTSALDVLIRQQRGGFLAVLQDLRDRLASGSALSEAMELHPSWFDDVFRSAVRVGQSSGAMDQSLEALSKYLSERRLLMNRLYSALTYPCVLLVLGIGVVLFLMSYVVPQLLAVLESSGREIPRATRMLKAFSDLLCNHWLALVLAASLFAVAVATLWQRLSFRKLVHAWLLKLPLVGILVRKSLIAEFAQIMSLLLATGVSFLEGVSLARRSCRNLVLAGELEAVESAVRRGSDIAPTLVSSSIFPPLVVHIVDVGQKTGELPEMLGSLRDGYEGEVRLAIQKFSAALEPLLIVLMAVVVGFIVFATMTPILEASRAIH